MTSGPGPVVKLLVAIRRANSLSQTDVATTMGTTQSAVSDLEGGRVEPRISTLMRYAQAVGADLRVSVQATVGLLAAMPEPHPTTKEPV